MRDTTLLLLLGTVTVIWWASIWGLFDAFVQKTKQPLLLYSLCIAVIVSFFYANPDIADKLL